MLESIQLRIRFYRNSCLKRPIHIIPHNILNLADFSFFFLLLLIFEFRVCLALRMNCSDNQTQREKDQNFGYNSDCK